MLRLLPLKLVLLTLSEYLHTQSVVTRLFLIVMHNTMLFSSYLHIKASQKHNKYTNWAKRGNMLCWKSNISLGFEDAFKTFNKIINLRTNLLLTDRFLFH